MSCKAKTDNVKWSLALAVQGVAHQISGLPEAVRAHGVSNRLAPPLAADGTAAAGGAAAMRPSSRSTEPIPNPLADVLRPDAGRRVAAEQHRLVSLAG